MDLNTKPGVWKFLYLVLLMLGIAFSQDYDYPTYSELDLPETSFSCIDKVNGAYYADIETGCQMYHVCSKDKFGFASSTKFLCGNGTIFDQRHLVCQDYRRVHRCHDSARYFRITPKKRQAMEERLRTKKREQEMLKAAEIITDYDYPTYSEGNLPATSFSCKDKVNGGYYADIEADCQMYHVCSKDKFGFMRSTRFLCGNGTVFDQRHLVCQDYFKVPRCKDSARYYRNTAAILELRLRAEKKDKEILKATQFDAGRVN